MTELRNQYQKAPVHPERVYAISPARAYAFLLSTVATSEFQSSVTEKISHSDLEFRRCAFHYAFDMFLNISMFYNLKRKRESEKG